jgi:rubrerythrin
MVIIKRYKKSIVGGKNMNVFEYALEKEKYAQEYYTDLAQKCTNDGLKYILNMLAEEEGRHVNIIQNMQSVHPVLPEESKLLANVKETFAKMRDSKEKFDFNLSQIDLYKKAQEIEKSAKEHYLGKMNELKDETQKKIFQKLADEEQKHYNLLQNIIDFISKPQLWLENAEFNHIDEY